MRKPVFGVSDKARLKSVFTATVTSYKIEISLVASIDMILFEKRIIKALIRLCGYTGWSAPLLFATPPKTDFLGLRPLWSLRKLKVVYCKFLVVLYQLIVILCFSLQHSCTPCAFVQNVFVDTHDLRFPWVAFFAGT